MFILFSWIVMIGNIYKQRIALKTNTFHSSERIINNIDLNSIAQKTHKANKDKFRITPSLENTRSYLFAWKVTNLLWIRVITVIELIDWSTPVFQLRNCIMILFHLNKTVRWRNQSHCSILHDQYCDQNHSKHDT